MRYDVFISKEHLATLTSGRQLPADAKALGVSFDRGRVDACVWLRPHGNHLSRGRVTLLEDRYALEQELRRDGGLACALVIEFKMDAPAKVEGDLRQAEDYAKTIERDLIYYVGSSCPSLFDGCVPGYMLIYLGRHDKGAYVRQTSFRFSVRKQSRSGTRSAVSRVGH